MSDRTTRRTTVWDVYAGALHWLRTALARRTGRRWWLSVPSILMSLFAAFAAANLIANPYYSSARFRYAPVMALVLLGVAAFPLVYAGCAALARWFDGLPRWARVLLLAAVLAACLAAQLALAYTVMRYPGFDARMVFETARNLAERHPLTANQIKYYEYYPNNVFLVLVYRTLFVGLLGVRIGAPHFLGATVVLNAVLLTAGIGMALVLTKRLFGTAAAVFALVPSIGFIVISPWIAVPYSDTVGLPFPILVFSLWVFARTRRSRAHQLALWAAIGVISVIGYAIKPTTVFALIAIGFVEVFRWHRIRRGDLRNIGRAVVSVALAGALFLGGTWLLPRLDNRAGLVPFNLLTNTQSMPLTHFLSMGATGAGGFHSADMWATVAMPPAQRSSLDLQLYFTRVHTMGVGGYAQFLGRKLMYNLGDGTFYQWGEGTEQQYPYIHTGRVSTAVQSFYDAVGRHHLVLTDAWQALWLCMLILLAAPLFLARRRLFSTTLSAMRLGTLGLFVFLLLFEARSRYIYLYLPVLIVLASASAGHLGRWATRARGDTGEPPALV